MTTLQAPLIHVGRAANPAYMGRYPQRVFPNRNLMYPDPFILLDHFAMQHPHGFPDHPHRGFEIISYVLGGAMAHEDSAGNSTVIPTGGVQTVTAGRGIIHSEMPHGDDISTGLQLWINLPRADKGVAPSYREFAPEEIPTTAGNDVTVRMIVGPGSPARIQRDIRYVDVQVAGTFRFRGEVPAGFQGFVYLLEGQGTFNMVRETLRQPFETDDGSVSGPKAAQGDLLFVPADADARVIEVVRDGGGRAPLRFVYAVGQPIGERPIYNGPFVD